MMMAFVTSLRSPDPSTKHGAVIVDARGRIVSTGFNGFVSKVDPPDPMTIHMRPEKYPWFIHAEMNCVLHADSNLLRGSTIVVTGRPCIVCSPLIMQAGVKRIVYGPIESKCMEGTDDYSEKMAVISEMARQAGVTIEHIRNYQETGRVAVGARVFEW